MTFPDEHARAQPPLAPPPQCPAHGGPPDGITRLYGPEGDTDPLELYERLRERHGAVAPVLLEGDLPAWLVLGYRENLEVVRTPTRFSRDSRHWSAAREGRLTADHPLAPVSAWQPICVFADGQVHERWRGAVNDSLDRFDRRSLRRHITRAAHDLIDAFCTKGTGDLVHHFAEPLPMLVMTTLLGMPGEYGPRLVEAARDMVKGTKTSVASNAYLEETLSRLVARKHVTPGMDLTSWLIEHPSGLSDQEVEHHLRLVLIMAFESTANLIANTLKMVLTDPRFHAHLAGGHLTWPDAVEQVLWDEPPFMTILGRWAAQDTELAGQQIKAGDALVIGLAAANTDAGIRPDPMAPIHGNRSHLAFSGGTHECPGQDIGRAIAETGIETLLTRLPDLDITCEEAELTWTSSLMVRHLDGLPVRFSRQPKRPAGTGRSAEPEAPFAEQDAAPRQPAAADPEPPAGAALLVKSWWRSLVRWWRGL
ncbi:cytochrome P450 [Streptomyces varsoviensis]|uniref:cytochrome P450 n=1 Tax=Streptomyces varsoviensis TaxID=67373 RepID=UPI0033D47A9F